MEKYICNKDCKVGYFKKEIKKGEEFPVLRNIMGECVLIVKDEGKPNIIADAKELRKYGFLLGTPVLGGL